MQGKTLALTAILSGALIIGCGVFMARNSKPEPEVEIVEAANEAVSPTGIKTEVAVDIEGAVNKPGVYKLETQTLVDDVIVLAGGLTSEADVKWVEKNVNKADKVRDGYKLYIPKLGESVSVSSAANTPTIISINGASASELDSLPGVGVVTAGKIISGRPYNNMQDLVTRKIIGQKLFDQIKDKISL